MITTWKTNVIFEVLSMECILIKDNLKEENFTDGKVIAKSMKFISLKNYIPCSGKVGLVESLADHVQFPIHSNKYN